MFKDALPLIILLSTIQSGTGLVQRTGSNFRFPKPTTTSQSLFPQKLPFVKTDGGSSGQTTARSLSHNHIHQSQSLRPLQSSTSGLFGTCNHERRRMPRVRSSNHIRFDTSTAVAAKGGDTASHDDGDAHQEKSVILKVYDASLGRIKNLFLFLLKLIILKPFSKLKSIFTRGKSIDGAKTDGSKVQETETKSLKSVSVHWEDEKNEKVSVASSVISAPTTEEPKVVQESEEVMVMESKEMAELPIEIKKETEVGSVVEEAVVTTKEKPIFAKEAVVVEEPFLEDATSAAAKATEKANEELPVVAATVEMKEEKPEPEPAPFQFKMPKGNRWAIAAPGIDLTGKWKLIVTEAFKEQYDHYLKRLGQPSLVRSVAVSIVEMTSEEVIQEDQGRSLCIKGKNLRGIWDRTLVSSGSNCDSDHDDENGHKLVPLVTADKEHVKAEAWWENKGTHHKSWLRGVKKYGGGDFESTRYLSEDDQNKLVCESVFHPKDKASSAEGATIRWEFQRV